MAFRGQRPKPDHLRVVAGEAEKAPRRDPALETSPDFDNGLKPPTRLKKREQELWNDCIIRMPWLTKFDVYKAHMWVREQAKYEKNDAATAHQIAQLRGLGSELGLDAPSRTRVKATENASKSKASKYFES